jgi:hypothetical protein
LEKERGYIKQNKKKKKKKKWREKKTQDFLFISDKKPCENSA